MQQLISSESLDAMPGGPEALQEGMAASPGSTLSPMSAPYSAKVHVHHNQGKQFWSLAVRGVPMMLCRPSAAYNTSIAAATMRSTAAGSLAAVLRFVFVAAAVLHCCAM